MNNITIALELEDDTYRLHYWIGAGAYANYHRRGNEALNKGLPMINRKIALLKVAGVGSNIPDVGKNIGDGQFLLSLTPADWQLFKAELDRRVE